MAVSRQTGWIAAGLLARLLMVAVLLMSVRFVLSNYIHWDHTQGIYKLQSYTYVVASAVVGAAGSVLQIPVAMYLLCKSKRAIPSAMILDISMHADIVSCCSAGSAAAGFGATNDVLRYVRASKWEGRQQEEQALINYYNRAIVPVVFLLVGMVLSICATVVSARLRARAINDSEVGA
ncbi:CASP-like protein 4D1 [Aegilops tauschii subsp. strangulata]|uniref:CASP-like protein 4D1 n=1 Tax=Aegilops tauschii subsp. strangulata TaxID=200361 RepID=UPI00098ACEC8|nr:CASP-like protein 4D1 [Aegilops tauschii subsp. strangulata]